MRTFTPLALVSLLALTACGEAADAPATGAGETVSDSQVAAALDDAVVPEPGLYRTNLELIDVSLPDIPGQNAETLRNMMRSSLEQEFQSCVAPDEAKQGYQDMLRQSQDGNCDFERFSTAGGNMDAKMVCSGEEGQATMIMTGTATSTSSDVTMNMTGSSPQGEMSMKMRVRNERIGDCPA